MDWKTDNKFEICLSSWCGHTRTLSVNYCITYIDGGVSCSTVIIRPSLTFSFWPSFVWERWAFLCFTSCFLFTWSLVILLKACVIPSGVSGTFVCLMVFGFDLAFSRAVSEWLPILFHIAFVLWSNLSYFVGWKITSCVGLSVVKAILAA